MKIRVASANLWAGAARPEAITRLLEQERPDVLAVQELTSEQVDVIAEQLPHGVLDPDDEGHAGMGIALRAHADLARVSLPDRDAHVARLDPGAWDGLERALEVVNVHVQAPHTLPPWRTLRRRNAQLRGILGHVERPPEGARLVCGDLNATPLWPVYRRLRAHLEDLAASHARSEGRRPPRTWGPWSGSPRLLRIDHVLGVGATVLEVRTLHLAGSDHSTVVVDLEL